MNFKLKKTWPITAAVTSILVTLSLPTFAEEISTADTEEAKVEKITIYGRHNQLILESGTATKST